MESSQHFVDKQTYFYTVSRSLRRHGRLLVAAWTGSMESHSVREVANHFLCPEICPSEEYVNFIRAAGLRLENVLDATEHVRQTWEICLRRIRRATLLKKVVSDEVRLFADGLACILDAYLSGDLTYTIIVAHTS